MLFKRVSDIDFTLGDLPEQPLPGRVLFASPNHYTIKYVINPHMEGQIGEVDRKRAKSQWEALREAYEQLGFKTSVLDGQRGLPDMVFCANQTLPFRSPDGQEKGVVLSRMYSVQRRDEVNHLKRFFDGESYRIVDDLPEDDTPFEGMGDALWHVGRRLLWGGYGYRTSSTAYEIISEVLDVPVIFLELIDPDFYHLDTCFCPLDEGTVLLYPGAFTTEGRLLIDHFFDTVLQAPEDDARNRFACNAHCPDGKHVIIQRGSTSTNHMLRDAGFVPVEVDTDEFLKSGGSVFCMKQMYW